MPYQRIIHRRSSDAKVEILRNIDKDDIHIRTVGKYPSISSIPVQRLTNPEELSKLGIIRVIAAYGRACGVIAKSRIDPNKKVLFIRQEWNNDASWLRYIAHVCKYDVIEVSFDDRNNFGYPWYQAQEDVRVPTATLQYDPTIISYYKYSIYKKMYYRKKSSKKRMRVPRVDTLDNSCVDNIIKYMRHFEKLSASDVSEENINSTRVKIYGIAGQLMTHK